MDNTVGNIVGNTVGNTVGSTVGNTVGSTVSNREGGNTEEVIHTGMLLRGVILGVILGGYY